MNWNRAFLVGVFFFSLVSHSSSGAEPLTPDQRADLLVAQWDAVAGDRSWTKNTVALASVVIGAPLALAGGIVLGGGSNYDTQVIGAASLGFGIGSMVGGAFVLLLETPYERSAAKTFTASAGLTGQARLDSYEKKFLSLVDEERQIRQWSGLGMGLLGVGASVAGFGSGLSSTNSGYAALAILGPALIASSALLYFMPDVFEARWDNYKRTGLMAAAPTRSFKLNAVPLKDGGMLVAALRF